MLLFFSPDPSYLPSEDTLIYRLLHLDSFYISGSVNTVLANYTFFWTSEILLESVFSLKEGRIDSADFLTPVCKSNSLLTRVIISGIEEPGLFSRIVLC